MVDEAQIAQGRWSPAVVPISAQTMAFLHQQVGEGIVRKRGATGRISHRQLPVGCPIPIEQTVWGATGMAWTDIDIAAAGTSPVNIVGVVSPTSADEVSAVLVWAHEMCVSVIPRGGGTSVVGGLQADQPSVLLDMQQMAHIVDFDPIDGLVHVQAGVTGPTRFKPHANSPKPKVHRMCCGFQTGLRHRQRGQCLCRQVQRARWHRPTADCEVFVMAAS
jgi:alkyldihydroxyacetonephosphate synthase